MTELGVDATTSTPSGPSAPKASRTERPAARPTDAPSRPVARRPKQLEDRHMPGDFAISIEASGGMDQILFGPQRERQQSMRGFEDTYVDIVDYITRITHKIWEERDFGYIYDTYAVDAAVNGSGGRKGSREEIVAESIQYSAAFPDLRLVAEDVVWAGDDEVGFRTSHRIRETGTNTGWCDWGAPTGKRTNLWVIANCSIAENEIYEEWVLDNTAATYRQLGLDLAKLARSTPFGEDTLSVGAGEIERVHGQGKPLVVPAPPDGAFAPDLVLRHALHQIWNWRNLSAIDRLYAPNARFHGSTDRELYGRGDIRQYVTTTLAMFPDLVHHVDEVYWQGNEQDGFLVSLRWSVVGTHLGHGPYGPPTGRRMQQWGICQYAIQQGVVVEEWNLFTEFEVLQQLLHPDAP